MNRLDWEELKEGWNARYETAFKNVKALLASLYKEPGEMRASELLGVSANAFGSEMQRQGLDRYKRVFQGFVARGKERKKVLLAMKTETMTSSEVAKILETKRGNAVALMAYHGKEFIRTKSGRRKKG